MNEDYLQFIWKMKRLPFHLMTTTHQQEIAIHSTGIHNLTESGPDFYNGSIRFNGINWFGNIEIHVKSSDWYKHNHHKDEAYSNVILHVVYENDCDVMIHNEKIPTIELKNFIDWKHYENWKHFLNKQHQINCSSQISKVDVIYLESMMEKVMLDRMSRKTNFISSNLNVVEPNQLLYLLIARAFGTKVNQLPFEELVTRLPIHLLKRYSKEKQISLIHWTSGLTSHPSFGVLPNQWVQLNNHYKIGSVASHSWKSKGLRPASKPENRIAQFSAFIAQLDIALLMEYLPSEKVVEYIFSTVESINNNLKHKLSPAFTELIIINSIVPFLWWYGNHQQNSSYQELAFELLTTLKPEKNKMIDQWKKSGVSPKNAFESQALMELYNEFCLNNKCLSCTIGIRVLN